MVRPREAAPSPIRGVNRIKGKGMHTSCIFHAKKTIPRCEFIPVCLLCLGLFFSCTMGNTSTRAATPTANPDGGAFGSDQSVTLSCDTPGATIWYSENGITPIVGMSSKYTGPIDIQGGREGCDDHGDCDGLRLYDILRTERDLLDRLSCDGQLNAYLL